MVIEISIGVVAAAIVLLVIYLIFTLRNVSKTLTQLRQTASTLEPDTHEVLSQLRQTANTLETDTHKILTNANELITETRSMVNQVKTKTENTDTLFQAINQIGKQVSEVSASFSKAAVEHREKLGGLFAILSAIVNLAREWRQNNQKGRIKDAQP